ncbi:MAG: HAMP domain-containing histidine kinase, partial [Nitrospinaceae bacterium]|nr:HAMP domain-containing histidine kinase [Nitrospinaceae bacterium]
PFRDVDGRLIGMVESFMDITLRKKAERALVEMDNIKNEFISTAAHELNTPLSSLMGYLEFLRDPEAFGGFTPEQKKDFINEAYDRGEALDLIISDLLDISRIESGKPLPLDLQELDLPDVLRRKARLFLAGKARNRIKLD